MDGKVILGRYNDKDLEWIPVFKNSNVYITKESICRMPFTNDHVCHYSTSAIRTFLNDVFLKETFSKDDLNNIVPNDKRNNDYVFLISYSELRNNSLKVNRKIFKEKKSWWLADHTSFESGNDALWGVAGRFGLVSEFNQSYSSGVRPCIILKKDID